MISDGDNSVMQNKCSKWIKFEKRTTESQKWQYSSAIYLHCVDMTDMQFQNLRLKQIYIYMINNALINMGLFLVET